VIYKVSIGDVNAATQSTKWGIGSSIANGGAMKPSEQELAFSQN